MPFSNRHQGNLPSDPDLSFERGSAARQACCTGSISWRGALLTGSCNSIILPEDKPEPSLSGAGPKQMTPLANTLAIRLRNCSWCGSGICCSDEIRCHGIVLKTPARRAAQHLEPGNLLIYWDCLFLPQTVCEGGARCWHRRSVHTGKTTDKLCRAG
jgi:hypothetical protein